MKKIYVLGITLTLALLQGCVTTSKNAGDFNRVGVVTSPLSQTDIDHLYGGLNHVGIIYLGKAERSSAHHQRKAEEAIKKYGDYALARVELGKALYQNAGNKQARILLDQLLVEPDILATAYGISSDLAGAHYEVKKGDTLEKLARKKYRQKLFYPLIMRLNTMSSAALTPGDIILLPRLQATPANRKATSSRKKAKNKSQGRTVKAKSVSSSVAVAPATTEKPVKAVKITSTPVAKPEVTKELSNTKAEGPLDRKADVPLEQVELQTTEQIREPVNKASESVELTAAELPSTQEKDAVEILGNEEKLLPVPASKPNQELSVDPDVMSNEIAVVSKPEPTQLVSLHPAEEALAEGEKKRAYRLLKQDQGLNAQQQTLLRQLKTELVEEPYSRGLNFYQKQKLNLAVVEFKNVLAVEPEHSQAQLYLTRSNALLEKLKNIK